MSRVKNILVSDIEIFEEELIRELIKNQISYVQIENEFHFLNHIYRIYDLEKIAQLIIQNTIKPKTSIVDSDNFSKAKEKYVPHINLNLNNINFCKSGCTDKMNKQLIKRYNRQVNKIINKK